MKKPEIAMIVAMDRARLIGKNGDLPWRLPDDLKHFKALTIGHPVIMGRKTYESIGRALPERRNVVLTRQASWTALGVEVVGSPEEAFRLVAADPRVFVIGGQAVYESFLPLTDVLYLTRVEAEVADGDAWFPDWTGLPFRCIERTVHPADDRHPFAFAFETYAKED
jgi:dihydrofolate reductase